ncbi:hypothetical protein EYF80_062996 [Liparis tanakae]|uniref:Uncharacterized protein n=1 Tax=Liparis tanakae TaxID=230148 RepID=A0A4Z2EEX6_9TELE|nr:hypothetical protein EYF80_062996 [Liparis tanakae]
MKTLSVEEEEEAAHKSPGAPREFNSTETKFPRRLHHGSSSSSLSSGHESLMLTSRWLSFILIGPQPSLRLLTGRRRNERKTRKTQEDQ